MYATPHALATVALTVAAPVTYIVLRFVSAPYGRHVRDGWGPSMPTRWAWVVMESPSAWFFALWFMVTLNNPGPVGIVFLFLWMWHYVYRAFVFPFRLRLKPGARMPVLIAGLAFVFNLLNSFVNAPVASGAVRPYDPSWFLDPRFGIGVALFLAGISVNRQADRILLNLRKPGETGYKIPHGGLYGWVSCPNYLGELMQWTGWAVATWSVEGLAFAVYTAANLVPRALDNHAWYRQTFPAYPPERRAVIPFLL